MSFALTAPKDPVNFSVYQQRRIHTTNSREKNKREEVKVPSLLLAEG
jgi:hypothetical protein